MGGTTIEKIEDAAGFEKLREEGNDLLRRSASDCLFLTWEWLHTWWTHLSEGRRLRILAVRCDGELAAAVVEHMDLLLLREPPAPAPEDSFAGPGLSGFASAIAVQISYASESGDPNGAGCPVLRSAQSRSSSG